MNENDLLPKANGLLDAIRNSHLIRLAILGALTLILLIPVSMIRGLIAERQDRHGAATKEITSKWGGAQVLTGPALILPYTVQATKRNAVFLPKQLKTTGLITQELRGRGIFEVPVYSLTATVEGEFDKPKIAELGIEPTSVDWSQAYLVVGVSDVRALRAQSKLSWNGQETEFLPGTKEFSEASQGLHAPVSITDQGTSFKFSFPLSVNGSESVYVVPFAEETVVQLRSNSPNPNFQGNWLPADRAVSKDGFDATWRISYLGRNYPQSWVTGASYVKAIESSRFGVELKEPIDQYRMADRSVKYAGLFIVLTFTSIWLLEVLANSAVHPVQYLMLGAALCVFYLLELSLAEHIRFSLAYGIAGLAIVAMIGAYGRTLFTRGQRGFVVPAGVALLYSYLYVLLTNEDAALLVGSVGLFAILATIMFITRGVNWYASNASPETH